MSKNEKSEELMTQPLMSTGITEPGFAKEANKDKPTIKPKIGDTVVGDAPR